MFEFPSRVIGICGLNGKGKTNLLDAIYYCCFTKSYFNNTDQLNVRRGAEGFRIDGDFARNVQHQRVVCIHRGTLSKKEFQINEVPYERLASHVGLLPAVMIAPDDVELISGGSELRRKFIDSTLSQLDSFYLQELLTYNKILQQRNSLLKNIHDDPVNAVAVLDILDQQLVSPGIAIFQKRSDFLAGLIPRVERFYHLISRSSETVMLDYVSQLKGDKFDALLSRNRSRDLASQRSNTGIHKDDIRFSIDGELFRNTASQGQRKSLLFALKFAAFEILKEHNGFAPLLLLDDVFEKLDAERMTELLRWVCHETDAKVFITDTHRHRLEAALNEINTDHFILEL